MKVATKDDMRPVFSRLVNGDALKRSDYDIIYQEINLPLGTKPQGNGWQIMTGSTVTNLWVRIAYRSDIDAGR